MCFLLQGSAKLEGDAEADQSEERYAGMAVRHLVLCVHGIGQRMGGMSIVDDAQEARRRVNLMLDSHLPASEIGKGYIEVLPVQWRKHLDLDVRAPLRTLSNA